MDLALDPGWEGLHLEMPRDFSPETRCFIQTWKKNENKSEIGLK
jgi:hypothetical protein